MKTDRRRTSTRDALRRAVVVALGAALLAVGLPTSPPPASAADLGQFDPGYLISDRIFYDSATMDAASIQAFLQQRAPSCVAGPDGTPCLKNYRQATASRAPDAKCPGGYAGAADERASDIIAKVAAACGINPRVILVMLQKEQGLVTGSGSNLYANRYRSAMGYGCPDTAACDAQYYGFFNQVYSAAAQLKNYALNPTRYSHKAGATNNVRFHPNAACGSSAVFIRNQATASLYNYTPYQPNAAALAAGYGTGDSCSAYGNRNFYSYFTDWFGKPTGVPPIGFLDEVTVSSRSVTASGWAIDPDTRGPISVHMYVDNGSQAFVANGSRPDVDAVYRMGPDHGYIATMPAEAGSRRVCVYAIDEDGGSGNTGLGCRTVKVPSLPRGVIDTVTTTPDSITVVGWAMDPDTPDPIPVHMYVDGTSAGFVADQSRPDLVPFFGNGDRHGFTATMPATPGDHSVCLWAIKPAPSENVRLGCRTVTVRNQTPIGWIDSVTATGDAVTAKGWALDPDTDQPVAVHMYVDGASAGYTADGDRPDIGAIFGKGDKHGFTATMPATPGPHTVCLYAINASPGPNTPMGCRTVTVRNNEPLGWIDSVAATATSVTATGWALDPDTDQPIAVHMYVDGVSSGHTADGSRPDIAAKYGLGDRHGYSATVPAGPGRHTVCLYAINTTPGANTNLGCRSVTVVADASPIGWIDSVSATSGSVTASGWALDPDTDQPINVHMYVDGVSAGFIADTPRPDIQALFGKGERHGFTTTMPAAAGSRSVCLFAINTGTAPHTPMGCRTVTVP
ncbi:hypothetical protein ICW40_01400 [Actinotalea ferrariae]|uniref:hypothetical protein n=1 Tax=Actinotalea ferrariae TaxID=1386098 RepID=UPI001C8B4162|nr:hypothetical protein [Actinotalea ferrariae]MBX9243459.1 hypothetical protein [Actinotalea ferrariae]